MPKASTDPPNTDQILSRLDRLEAAVFGSPSERKLTKPVATAARTTLPQWILRLRDEGFFNPAKTPAEVYAGIKEDYPCELDRVMMALIRLQRRRELRKTSKIINGRKYTAYVR